MAHVSKVIGNIIRKKCIIVDDIIDTGEIICKAPDLLMKKGTQNFTACVTHIVLLTCCINLVKQ
ncbi:MAG: phosphoribosyltransferase family protein [Alphaproteobacteria bacterium]|nr:phosphoribosyltransferase family protein [Alphaproteobacteria bacterium]